MHHTGGGRKMFNRKSTPPSKATCRTIFGAEKWEKKQAAHTKKRPSWRVDEGRITDRAKAADTKAERMASRAESANVPSDVPGLFLRCLENGTDEHVKANARARRRLAVGTGPSCAGILSMHGLCGECQSFPSDHRSRRAARSRRVLVPIFLRSTIGTRCYTTQPDCMMTCWRQRVVEWICNSSVEFLVFRLALILCIFFNPSIWTQFFNRIVWMETDSGWIFQIFYIFVPLTMVFR